MIALPPQIVHDLHVQRKPLPRYPEERKPLPRYLEDRKPLPRYLDEREPLPRYSEERSKWPNQPTGLRKPGQRTSPPLILNDRYPGLPLQDPQTPLTRRTPQNDHLRAIHGTSSVSMRSDVACDIIDSYLDEQTPSSSNTSSAIQRFDFGLENTDVPRLAVQIPPITTDSIDGDTSPESATSQKGFFRRTSKKPSPIPRRRRKAKRNDRRDSLSICCQGQLEPDFFSQPDDQSSNDRLYPTKYSFSNSSRSRKDSGTSMSSSQLDLPSRSSRSGATSQNSLRYTSSSAISHSSLSQPYSNNSQHHLSQLSFGEALAEGDDLKPKSPLAKLFSRSLSKKSSAPSSPKSPISTSSTSQNRFMAAMRRMIPKKHDTKL
ncbi:hypothetical protein MRB53_038885 [Persea americana]|nr:hypothetical protein MRB53_038885 [Persea americana]